MTKIIEFGIHKQILYRHELSSFEPLEDGNVKVNIRNVKTDEKFSFVAPALHIRTGTLMMPKKVVHNKESLFKGTISMGISNDLTPEQIKGKNVVILGSGAFGKENVDRCLKHGAKSIKWICRHF